jgi:4-hydroxythreonine-4-phosphate dehydrogenase
MLALTMGDPAGIGGELTVSAWRALRHGGPAFAAIDDPARLAGIPVRAVESLAEAAAVFPDALPVLPQPLAAAAVPGRPDGANAAATIASIERAVRLAQAGEAAAVVTNPISKAVLYAAGFSHPGHTEFLGALTGCAHPVMMLANDFLRVVPVTVHVSLRAALDGFGIAYLPQDQVQPHLDSAALTWVLKDWSPPFPGYHLYYPSRRQPAAALAVLIEALRYRG